MSANLAPGRVLRIAKFRRCVANLDRAVDFYVGALGFEVTEAAQRAATLTLGDESIELVVHEDCQVLASDRATASVSSAGFQHIAIVTNAIEVAQSRLAKFHPKMISQGGAVRLPASSGGVWAFKFRDPDGHPLELIQFPPAAGNPKWQRPDRIGPTLGFDHSAIAVVDVSRSLEFYVRGLGLELGARQINRGAEQARLDGCTDAVVEVVALIPTSSPTPHLELLGYRHPAPQALDAWPPFADCSDRLHLIVDDLQAIARRLQSLRPGILSDFDKPPDGAAWQARLADDDGHLLLLTQS